MPDIIKVLDPRVGDTPAERWGPLAVIVTWLTMGLLLYFVGLPPPDSGAMREGAIAVWGALGGLAVPWLKAQMG